MADPISLGLAVSAGSAIVGGVTSYEGAQTQAAGAVYTGKAQAAQANYQAGVADLNAKLAAEDANYALAAGEVDVEKAGLAGGQMIGATKAGQGAGNVAVGTGSAGRVVSSEVEATQENEAVADANRIKAAYGFSVQSAEDTAQAGAYRAGATTAQVAAGYSAEASILGGVSSVATKFGQFGQSFGVGSSAFTNSSAGDAFSDFMQDTFEEA